MRLITLMKWSLSTLVTAALLTPSAPAQNIHSTLVASGFSRPLWVGSPPGDTHRLFVVEQFVGTTGRIRIIKDGVVLATPFLSITPVSAGNEQGLLGLAFDPNYATNRRFFVYFTNPTDTVQRWFASAANPDVADTVTGGLTMIAQADPESNHNGGNLAFGPDGRLYVGIGDGGGANDQHGANGNGQLLTTKLGKMLRLDPDNPPTWDPGDNPWSSDVDGIDDLLWFYGLRNPWRWSFDRLTGDMYIGDVGQGAVEEVDFAPAGASGLNFGWRCMEGTSCTGLTGCTCNSPTLTMPIQTYTHSTGICITGGFVYRGNFIPSLQGTYFYADYSFSKIWSFTYNGMAISNFTDRSAQLTPSNAITSFGEDARGEMYIVHQGGSIYRIDGPPPGQGFCYGDDSNPFQVFCPCSNPGSSGHGCANSTNAAGALLTAQGASNPDTALLLVSGMPASASAIFLKGDMNNTTGVVFGDGVLCASGSLIRLRTKTAVNGFAEFPEAGDPSLSVRGATPPGSGLLAYYQVYYRNAAAAFCPPETFNVTNGYDIFW